MPTATLRSLGQRAIPLTAAAGIAFAGYTVHTQLRQPIRNDAAKAGPKSAGSGLAASGAVSLVPPFTPLGWGSNTYLTLCPDEDVKQMKRPMPLKHLGTTPLRDLTIHEKYGACIDAQGDLWMWGAGYDPSGAVGRSLRGKRLRKVVAGPGKLFGLSKDGRLYVVSADRSFQEGKKAGRAWYWRLTTRDPLVDFVELQASEKFHWGEKWVGVAAGQHHLLAVTNRGRTFSLPLSPSANTHRQLGTKQTFPRPETPQEALQTGPALPPESDPRFATVLTEIPALSGIDIAQVAASDRSSFVRTDDGRVLGFGANDFGQIGLGNTTTVATVPTPVEIVLSKAYTGGYNVKCTNVTAASQTTFFTVERGKHGETTLYDLLSCGNGQSGALGTGMWSSAAYGAAKVKTVSGIQEYSEKDKKAIGIAIHNVSVSASPSTHVLAVLDTLAQADAKGAKDGLFGRDVLVWGGNGDYQLGNGKRSSVAVPQYLPSLVPHAIDNLVADTPESEESPMPMTRLQLHTTKADAYDLEGKLLRRGKKVEETVIAGWNCTVLYNKIVD